MCCGRLNETFENITVSMYWHVYRRRKKPLKPSVSLQLASSTSNRDDIPKPIPVLCSYVANDVDRTVVFAHGNFVKPVFEKMVGIFFNFGI